MSVVVDIGVWSLGLRRRQHQLSPAEAWFSRDLAELIREQRVILLGMIRQEVLSGIRVLQRFQQLRDVLRDFEDEPVSRSDHERAAEHYNTCQSHGIQGSHTDFLLCAVAEPLGAAVFTTDGDFDRYAQHLPIALYQPREDLR